MKIPPSPYEVQPSRWPVVLLAACPLILVLAQWTASADLSARLDSRVERWLGIPSPVTQTELVDYVEYLAALEAATPGLIPDRKIVIGDVTWTGSNLVISSDGTMSLRSASTLSWDGTTSIQMGAVPQCSRGQFLVVDNPSGKWSCK